VGDAIQAFRLGYAPYGWDTLASYLRQQGVTPLAAEKVGLLVPRTSGSGYYDRFRHRLMFAVIDVMGRVVAFSGRALPDPPPDELASLGIAGASPKPASPSEPAKAPGQVAKYINSPESPIYVKGEHLFGLHQARQSIRQRGEAIVVEGNFDVVGLHARGVSNVVAPLGTAFTPTQAKLLKRFAPTVTILFDPDEAGKKATRASRGPCREAGLNVRVASLPAGLDPDEFARKQGPEAINRVVKSASGMLEHLIYDALESGRFGGATLAEQHARVRAVAALLSEEDDPSLRLMAKTYADRLSSKLVLEGRSPGDLHQLEHIIQQATSGRDRDGRDTRGGDRQDGGARTPAPVPHDRARSRIQVDDIALHVLGSILDFPDLLEDPEVEAAVTMLDGPVALAVAAARQSRGGQMGLYADEFLAQIPGPIHSFAAGRLASPEFDAAGEAKDELLKNALKLRRLSLMREKAAGAEELHRAEALGDVASEEALMRDAQRRTREKLGLA
jgi:DNA primase